MPLPPPFLSLPEPEELDELLLEEEELLLEEEELLELLEEDELLLEDELLELLELELLEDIRSASASASAST